MTEETLKDNVQHDPNIAIRKVGLTSYRLKVRLMVTFCVCLLIGAAIIVYFLYTRNFEGGNNNTYQYLHQDSNWIPDCSYFHVNVTDPVDCYPENLNVNREQCETRGCCFLSDSLDQINSTSSVNTSVRCAYPKNYGYKVCGDIHVSVKYHGYCIALERLPVPPRYGDDIQIASVLVEEQTSYRTRIKFYDPISKRFEVPDVTLADDDEHDGQKPRLYAVVKNASNVPFSLRVERMQSSTVIFDTSIGATVLSDHFLEVSSSLPSKHIYGLGNDGLQKFTKDPTEKSFTLFSDPSANTDAGVHPFYLCIEPGGKAHGVLLLNSNAMEVHFSPRSTVTFRTIGGVLDFYIFLGPTPENVIQQYTEVIGRPILPPYWALGLHLAASRHGTVDKTKDLLQLLYTRNIPCDVVHLESDQIGLYPSANQSEVDGLIDYLKDNNKRIMVSVRPTVKARNSYEYNDYERTPFVKDKWGSILCGKINDETVMYVDFGFRSHWWSEVVRKLKFSIKFDALDLIDNQPINKVNGSSNGCINDDLNHPPYIPRAIGDSLYSNTLCMNALQTSRDKYYFHYSLHNMYGHFMSSATHRATKWRNSKERTFLTSESTFVGSGQFVGHWIKVHSPSWSGLQSVISTAINYNVYGIPAVGIQMYACNISETLLIRWLQLAQFLPLSMLQDSHCDDGIFIERYSSDFYTAVQKSVMQRYELLPYLYTLFYLAHTEGSTVLRTLAQEFPESTDALSVDGQFMWGSALLIVPFIQKEAERTRYFLPKGTWYDFNSGRQTKSKSEWFNVAARTYDSPLVFIRSGHIIATQQNVNTTADNFQQPIRLIVALNSSFEAEGLLFIDDGTTRDTIAREEYILVKFTATKISLTMSVVYETKTNKSWNIGKICMMGLSKKPTRVTLDDRYVLTEEEINWRSQVLDLNVLIRLEGKAVLKW